jgi:hypothetical protein
LQRAAEASILELPHMNTMVESESMAASVQVRFSASICSIALLLL